MKKSLMLAAAALALMTAGQAHADEDFKYTPYVGIDYTYSNAYADSMKPNYNSGSVNVGTMYNQFFGTELFYQYSDSATKGKHFDDRWVVARFECQGVITKLSAVARQET